MKKLITLLLAVAAVGMASAHDGDRGEHRGFERPPEGHHERHGYEREHPGYNQGYNRERIYPYEAHVVRDNGTEIRTHGFDQRLNTRWEQVQRGDMIYGRDDRGNSWTCRVYRDGQASCR